MFDEPYWWVTILIDLTITATIYGAGPLIYAAIARKRMRRVSNSKIKRFCIVYTIIIAISFIAIRFAAEIENTNTFAPALIWGGIWYSYVLNQVGENSSILPRSKKVKTKTRLFSRKKSAVRNVKPLEVQAVADLQQPDVSAAETHEGTKFHAGVDGKKKFKPTILVLFQTILVLILAVLLAVMVSTHNGQKDDSNNSDVNAVSYAVNAAVEAVETVETSSID